MPEATSEPNGSVVPASHSDLLAAPLIAHLASHGPHGEPQSTPVWFDWNGTHLLIAVGPDSQKYRNTQRDPRLSVSIADPQNPGRYLEVRGRVAGINPDSDRTQLHAIIRKYTGQDELQGLTAERVLLVIDPVHTTSMG